MHGRCCGFAADPGCDTYRGLMARVCAVGMVQHRLGHDADERVAHFLRHIATTSGRVAQTRLGAELVSTQTQTRTGELAGQRHFRRGGVTYYV